MKLLSILFFIYSIVLSDGPLSGIDVAITQQKNEYVKKRLKQFKSEGIEINVDTSHYNPDSILILAKSYLGTPHAMGGTSKRGMDCSGLVRTVHLTQGIDLPHNSHKQAHYGKIIPYIDSLQKGDLVFFYNSYNSAYFITHSGIYCGDGRFIHATVKAGVIYSPIKDPYYWKSKFLFGTRLNACTADSLQNKK
jgi:cell wall-associated NlpC family hydrolase